MQPNPYLEQLADHEFIRSLSAEEESDLRTCLASLTPQTLVAGDGFTGPLGVLAADYYHQGDIDPDVAWKMACRDVALRRVELVA